MGAADLARAAMLGVLVRTALDPARLDEVIVGCVAQPADALNLARVARASFGNSEACTGPYRATQLRFRNRSNHPGVASIQSGQGELYLVGGVESMSSTPMLFPKPATKKFASLASGRGLLSKARAVAALRPQDFVPTPALRLGLSDPVSGLNMGETAEVLAREFEIGRARTGPPSHCGRMASGRG